MQLVMFCIKKVLSSVSKNDKGSKCESGCLEIDAVPVSNTNANEVLMGGSQEHIEASTSSYQSIDCQAVGVNECASSSENSKNVKNFNQQVVMQFSNINGLQIGSTYNINRGDTHCRNSNYEKTKRCKTKHTIKYLKTVTIEAMMKSKDEPTNKMFNEIATHLGSDYKFFMRELGFSEGQITTAYLDHNVYGTREVIYQLLLDWERNTDGEKTVGYLTTLLWNCGYCECVHRLKLFWKSEHKNIDMDNYH